MKILILNYEFPPLGGGAGNATYDLAKAYVAHGYSVCVVTMGYKGLPAYEKKDGIEICRVKCLRAKKDNCYLWELPIYLLSTMRFLKKHMKNNHYDCCHCHFILPTGLLAWRLNKKYGLSYIITAHGGDVPGHFDRFRQVHKLTGPFLRMICRSAKKVVSPSQYLLNQINKNVMQMGDKGMVIPNGIYPEPITPEKKGRIILSTGRLYKSKGFACLILAVSNRDIGYEVHIAGDGPMMPELRQLAAKSKTKVVLHGWLDNQSDKYQNLLRNASIYSLVSEKENASIALLEAMAAGCAVITSNVSGCPETIGDTGIIIPPQNVNALKKAIEQLTGNDALVKDLGNKARKRIENIYSWENIFKQYEEILLLCNNSN